MEHKWERAMESGFSVINPIYIKGRAYLMQYKQTDGSFMLFEIRADGRGLTELWRGMRRAARVGWGGGRVGLCVR